MKQHHALVDMWNGIKKNIIQIFQPSELSNIARQTNFIQRDTSILQGIDFVELMTAVSINPKAISLEGLCSELRDRNPEADLRPQSLMERINQPEAADFLKEVFLKSVKKGLVGPGLHNVRNFLLSKNSYASYAGLAPIIGFTLARTIVNGNIQSLLIP